MKIGMVGLGRMGGNMARRLRRGGIEVVAWNRSFEVTEALARETGAQAAASFEQLLAALPAPRVVWLMLPAGQATDEAIERLAALATPGDLIVDGANGYYRDAIRHAKALAARGLEFIDCGVSGGIWGLGNGYCLMFGGEPEAAARVIPYMRVLAPTPDTGWLHCGPVGAGHFTKMIHNGIEYGMMQALAEGFALLEAKSEFGLNLAAIAELWRHGSVVRSWLLDLTAQALAEDQQLADIAPYVPDSGEGRWTALEAVEQGVPTPVMTMALMMRFATQGRNDFPARLLAMMRKGFGGHAVKTGGEK
ncbi:phosphogluconate dehydrogenase (NAD(+)-dependent, decarboxylating) [Thiobacter aerophilum]|uniref:Decarboxylating 6-phosphogluconate dehydrogenase n=1 Tax=Thiobacter aerophilum TaxID=3121275 RepID=A0ABV0EEF3_9BURK